MSSFFHLHLCLRYGTDLQATVITPNQRILLFTAGSFLPGMADLTVLLRGFVYLLSIGPFLTILDAKAIDLLDQNMDPIETNYCNDRFVLFLTQEYHLYVFL